MLSSKQTLDSFEIRYDMRTFDFTANERSNKGHGL